MEYDFSIIVPVYNAQAYLNNCIDSLINQKNVECRYELVLVNDGSSDKSLEILSQYSKDYNNIVVVNQKNQGVAAARNAGIRNSSGRYVLFVDSDDWLEDNTISEMHRWSEHDNPDILMFNYSHIYKDGKREEREISEDCVKKVGRDRDALNYMSYAYIWDKAYKRSIIEQNNIYFEEDVHFGEDTIFLCQYLMHVDTVAMLKECLYNYRENDKGASLSNKYVKDMDYVTERIWEYHNRIEQRNPGFMETAAKRHYYGTLCLQVIYNMYHVDSDLLRKERYTKLKKYFKLKMYDYILDETPSNIVKRYIVSIYKFKKVMPLDIGLVFFRLIKGFM